MPEFYQIRVKGHFSPQLAAWFDDLTVTNTPEGEAVQLAVNSMNTTMLMVACRPLTLWLHLRSLHFIMLAMTLLIMHLFFRYEA